MVDYLLEKGIEPVVSLVHFDMPDYLLNHYNGFMNKEVIDDAIQSFLNCY